MSPTPQDDVQRSVAEILLTTVVTPDAQPQKSLGDEIQHLAESNNTQQE
jgi:hypothetical protein